MSFYDSAENVQKYIAMCEGYDGSNLHQALAKELPEQAQLLELGSGAGLDIRHLKTRYQVTGSDLSDEFLKVCRQHHPDVHFLKLNALDLKVEQHFDGIYSNKVLHHLTEKELRQSLLQQAKILNNNGKIAHSFWLGEGTQTIHGMLFTWYQKEQLLNIISAEFKVCSTLSYQEFEPDDSLFVIAQKK